MWPNRRDIQHAEGWSSTNNALIYPSKLAFMEQHVHGVDFRVPIYAPMASAWVLRWLFLCLHNAREPIRGKRAMQFIDRPVGPGTDKAIQSYDGQSLTGQRTLSTLLYGPYVPINARFCRSFSQSTAFLLHRHFQANSAEWASCVRRIKEGTRMIIPFGQGNDISWKRGEGSTDDVPPTQMRIFMKESNVLLRGTW